MVATAECRFSGGHKMVAYRPLLNNTSVLVQSHHQNAIRQWPPCYGHHRNDIRRWPTFIIVTKAISFFKIFIHSKGHSLLDFSLMKPLFLDFQFLCHTGREWLIRSHSSARFSFELSGNSNKPMPCNLNFHQNFELEISLN